MCCQQSAPCHFLTSLSIIASNKTTQRQPSTCPGVWGGGGGTSVVCVCVFVCVCVCVWCFCVCVCMRVLSLVVVAAVAVVAGFCVCYYYYYYRRHHHYHHHYRILNDITNQSTDQLANQWVSHQPVTVCNEQSSTTRSATVSKGPVRTRLHSASAEVTLQVSAEDQPTDGAVCLTVGRNSKH